MKRVRVRLSLAFLLGISLVVAACGTTSRTIDQTASPARSQATPSSEIANEVVAALFPASAADWAAGESLAAFELAVTDRLADRCLNEDGLPSLPDEPYNYAAQLNNEQFPDFREIAQQDLMSLRPVSTPNPTRGMSRAEAKAYRAAMSRCLSVGYAVFTPIVKFASGQLGGEWQNQLSQVDASKPVQAALSRFVSCVRGRGVNVSSFNSFFDYVTNKVLAFVRSRSPEAQSTDDELSRIYVRCMTPVEAIRVRLRARARASFFASHALALDSLRSAADRVIDSLEQKTGVKLTSQNT